MTDTNTNIAPAPTNTSVVSTPSSDNHLLFGSIWFLSQLFGGAASYLVYTNEYKFWMNLNNPNNYSTGWDMWLGGWFQPYRYWYVSMFWQLGWTGVSLINFLFCLLGLDTAFNIINLISILAPLGNLALASGAYFL
jgi:hypothetical protein